jgi:hypothetical protein
MNFPESTETIEIPQVTPLQDRNLFEVKSVQGMGGLMYQQAQLLMKQMQDNLDLVRWTRPPTDNPEESQTGSSGPGLTNLDNISGSDNAESTMPSAVSPVGVTTQPEVG